VPPSCPLFPLGYLRASRSLCATCVRLVCALCSNSVLPQG
jgi:hypothetical protein